MKGIIRENLGASRYIVGVTPNAEPVSEIKAKLDAEYDDASQKLIQAQGDLQAVQDSYNAILAVIVELTANYQACLNEFNLGQCIDQKTAICAADYSACEDECYEIESGEGECDFECWTQRDACLALCRNQRTACEAEAVIACQEAQQAHVTACQEQWAPQIAALQTQALAAMEPIQAALKQIQDLEAQKLSLARRIYELETVAAKEEAITCWRAQFDDTLTAGAEVEVARTPGGRTVITEIVAPDACWQDARGLPGTHLFVNAAIAPGFETWRPTWRTGTVKALLPAEDKLEVEVKSGTMTGSLGTLYSRTPLDCTPPKSYFDGNWQTAESRIAAARDALKAAQESLAAAAQARDDCIGQYDQTWSNACYTDKAAICDQVWAEWLANCEAVGEDPAICQEQYQASLAACYAQSLADCADERDALIAQCREDLQPAVDAAQAAVEDAAESLNLELAGRYQPASPLILKLPVEHCNLERYAVDDDVLVDFPVREASEANPMAVWESGRVIGWASETGTCCCGGLEPALTENGYGVVWSTWQEIRTYSPFLGYRWETVAPPEGFIQCVDGVVEITCHDTTQYGCIFNIAHLGDIETAIEFEIEIDGLGFASGNAVEINNRLGNGGTVREFYTSIYWTRICSKLDTYFPVIRVFMNINQLNPGSTVVVRLRQGKGPEPGFCTEVGLDDAATAETIAGLESACEEASDYAQQIRDEANACTQEEENAWNECCEGVCAGWYPDLGTEYRDCVNNCAQNYQIITVYCADERNALNEKVQECDALYNPQIVAADAAASLACAAPDNYRYQCW